MVTTPISFEEDLLYPSSDGQPMAENTEQYNWIVLIKENLEILFCDRDDVFIAGDLLWYPVSVTQPPAPSQAPDVMVVLGRPRGPRLSYKQWEEDNIAPQVAFEILSQSNKTTKGRAKMREKLAFYEKFGVEEYYIYDPDTLLLEGYLRSPLQTLMPIAQMSNWVSPLLGIRFDWQMGRELVLYRGTGDRFLSPLELEAEARRYEAEAQRSRLEAQRDRVEAERSRGEAERNKVEANQFKARAERAEEQVVRMQRETAERLLGMGMSREQVAEVLGVAMVYDRPEVIEALDGLEGEL